MRPRAGLAAAAILALLAGAATAQRPSPAQPGGGWGSAPAQPGGGWAGGALPGPGRFDPYGRPLPPPQNQGSGLFLAVPPELLLPQPEMVGPPPPAPGQPMFTDGWTRDGFGASR